MAMRSFRIVADAEFLAEDVDDAFLKLAEHFRALAAGDDTSLIEAGTVEIWPEEETEERAIHLYVWLPRDGWGDTLFVMAETEEEALACVNAKLAGEGRAGVGDLTPPVQPGWDRRIGVCRDGFPADYDLKVFERGQVLSVEPPD